MNALALAIKALQSIITLVPLSQQLVVMYQNIISSLQQMQAANRNPTAAEWAALDQAVAALEAQLKAQ